MKEQQFIQLLSDNISDYRTPEQAISQANSCDSLSNDIYTDSKRFIYELLQNADDASCDQGKLDFQIDFVDNYIVVSHKGEPFSEVDIKSICSIGDGNKRGDENKTGFKGIGFKSVFAHSENVIIKTGNYCFKFDKKEANRWNPTWGSQAAWQQERRNDNKEDDIKLPWQIIPFWTEIPQAVQHLPVFNQSGYTVSTIIEHNKIEALKKSLIELFSESQIILFLRSREIKITINTNHTLLLEKVVVDNTITLKRNHTTISQWYIKTEQFDIPQEVRQIIQNDHRYPRKLRESQRTEISFAIQLENGKLKPADKDKQLIFTYLPTSINHGLPFLVNGNFLTDAGRQNIHIDLEWNQWLFHQIPLCFFSWMAQLAHKESRYNKQFLSVLPKKLNGFNALEQNFNEGYTQALRTIAFIPNHQGDLLKVSEALYDDTHLSDFIGQQTLIDYINTTRHKNFTTTSLVPLLYPVAAFRRLGIETFKVEDLNNFFTSQEFTTGHQLNENYNLITFLYQQATNPNKPDQENEWNHLLQGTPFIFDADEQLQQPARIYFPSVQFTSEFQDDINVIHPTVLAQIDRNTGLKKWLETLGVKEPTDVNFIDKTIIGDDDFVTTDNAIQVGQYLFNSYQKGELSDYTLGQLKKVGLLTQQGTLKEAQECFLSNHYDPKLQLEQACDIDFFVSEAYCDDKSKTKEWGAFLLKIGVKEDVEWIRKSLYAGGDYEPHNNSYFSEIPRDKIGKEYAAGNFYCHSREFIVHHLSFYNYTQDNYPFSKLFWSKAFGLSTDKKWEDYIKADTSFYGPGFYGYYYDIPITKYMDTAYFEWTLNTLSLLPTTQQVCHPAPNIYNNNIPQIHELAGTYLPILDYDGILTQEWQELLQLKDQLKVDDYLQILTHIWQDTTADEEQTKANRKRISLIYKKLAELYPTLNTQDKDKIHTWSQTNQLLARDGQFYSPSQLTLVTVDGFNADNLIYTDTRASQAVIQLLSHLGVTIIDSITPTFSNSMIEQESLRNRLSYISPLIALVAVEKSKNKKEWQDEHQRIQNKLTQINFYETTEILLSYGNQEDLQARSTYAHHNSFYYVGNWYKPRVLDGLVEPLRKFLGIQSQEVDRMLTVLLTDSFDEGLKYLEEKGYDTSLIPTPEATLEAHIPNQNIRAYNTTDEDIGKKGEMIVFEELKQIYSHKYQQAVEEQDDGFTIGNQLQVIWRNKSANTTANHDFKIKENGHEIYIDSKATPHGKNVEKVALYISGNELALMETAQKYLIARVYNTFATPSVEFVKLQLDQVTDSTTVSDYSNTSTNNN